MQRFSALIEITYPTTRQGAPCVAQYRAWLTDDNQLRIDEARLTTDSARMGMLIDEASWLEQILPDVAPGGVLTVATDPLDVDEVRARLPWLPVVAWGPE